MPIFKEIRELIFSIYFFADFSKFNKNLSLFFLENATFFDCKSSAVFYNRLLKEALFSVQLDKWHFVIAS